MAVDVAQIQIFLLRIEHLKLNQDDGDGGVFERFSAQAEIFRLSGTVHGILTSARNGIWAELESYGVVKKVVLEDLNETWKQMQEMKIFKSTFELRNVSRNAPEVEFPMYLDLPGPVVRQNILSYLTDPNDELSVAKAIPSEIEYLSGPLNLIRLKTVFHILMKRKWLLEPVDVMNLSATHSYAHGFIQNYFDTVFYKDIENLGYGEKSMALKFVPTPITNFSIIPLVTIDEFSEATWNKLQSCGNQILHCKMILATEMNDEQQLQWMKSYLELMPNLSSLCIFECPSFNEVIQTPPTSPDLFPQLPFLRSLVVHFRFQVEQFQGQKNERLLEAYGGQPELLSIYPFYDPQIPISWTNLSSLSLTFGWSNTLETTLHFMNRIADCPLKVFNLNIRMDENTPRSFQRLLTPISNNWGGKLERLGIHMQARLQVNLDDEVTWTHNLEFPKLKQFAWENCYALSKDWEFLLHCPVLEKLSYFQVSNYEVMEEQPELRPWIELYNEKERMLRSNVWKLFPKLEQIRFNDLKKGIDGRYQLKKVCITRKECQ